MRNAILRAIKSGDKWIATASAEVVGDDGYAGEIIKFNLIFDAQFDDKDGAIDHGANALEELGVPDWELLPNWSDPDTMDAMEQLK